MSEETTATTAGTLDQASNLGEQQQSEQTKTFTQEEVNGFVAKEAKKAQEKLFRELGFDDIKSAKDGMNRLKEWQESQKTEQDKITERLQELESSNGSLAQQKAELEAKLAAVSLGVDTDSMDSVITLAKAMVNEEVDISTAIQQVVDKHPFFKSGQVQEAEPKPSFSTGNHQRQNPTTDDFVKALGLKN